VLTETSTINTKSGRKTYTLFVLRQKQLLSFRSKKWRAIELIEFLRMYRKQKKTLPAYHTSIRLNFLCQNSLSSFRLGTIFYCPLPHFTSSLVKISYYLCKRLFYV